MNSPFVLTLALLAFSVLFLIVLYVSKHTNNLPPLPEEENSNPQILTPKSNLVMEIIKERDFIKKALLIGVCFIGLKFVPIKFEIVHSGSIKVNDLNMTVNSGSLPIKVQIEPSHTPHKLKIEPDQIKIAVEKKDG